MRRDYPHISAVRTMTRTSSDRSWGVCPLSRYAISPLESIGDHVALRRGINYRSFRVGLEIPLIVAKIRFLREPRTRNSLFEQRDEIFDFIQLEMTSSNQDVCAVIKIKN